MIDQEDFGCLGIRDETEPGFLLDVVEHIALSRKNSEKSLEDLEFRSERQESSCTECVMTDNALEELLMLFSKQTTRTHNQIVLRRDASMPLESGNEQIRKTLSPELLRPPRRYPRRFWVGLVRRMLRHQSPTATFGYSS
jgi:hypothetical protein